MVRRVGVATVFCSPRAAERKEQALAHLRARKRGAEGLAIGSSLDALTDLYGLLAREGRSFFGDHRVTLARIAAQIAAPRLAARELATAGPLPLEALCARVVSALHHKGKLGRFGDVHGRPGLPPRHRAHPPRDPIRRPHHRAAREICARSGRDS